MPAQPAAGPSLPGRPQRVASRRLDDVDQLPELFARWDGDFHQLSRGRFEATARVMAGRVLRIFEVQANQTVLTRGLDQAGHVAFIPVTTGNEACLWQRRRLVPGQLIAKAPDVAFHQQTHRDALVRCLLVPRDTLREAALALGEEEWGRETGSWNAFDASPGRLAGLRSAMNRLLVESARDPALLDGAEGAELENDCLRRLVDVLGDAVPAPALPVRQAEWRALAQRGTDWLHDRMQQPVTAADLCRELGVADRVLRRAFLETCGMGPMAYLRVMRLHGVRAALRSSRGSGATVAGVAEDWGFRRLGTFAAEYHRLFGERPSETLGVRGWAGVQSMSGQDRRILRAAG